MSRQDSTSRAELRDIMALLPAVSVGVTTTFFVLGLLIVGSHLARYGAFAGDLGRAEYLLAGALYVFLTALTTLLSLNTIDGVRYCARFWKEGSKRRAIWSILKSILSLVLVLSFAISVLSGYRLMLYEWRIWIASAVLMAASIHVRQMYFVVQGVVQSLIEKAGMAKDERRFYLLRALEIAPMMLLHVGAYSTIVYPHLAAAYGGGHRGEAVLYLDEVGIGIAASSKLPVNLGKSTCGPIEVLTESSQDVVLLSRNAEEFFDFRVAVRIKRDHVRAIIGYREGTSTDESLRSEKSEELQL